MYFVVFKVYDHLWQDVHLSKLPDIGFSPEFFTWTRNYLSEHSKQSG